MICGVAEDPLDQGSFQGPSPARGSIRRKPPPPPSPAGCQPQRLQSAALLAGNQEASASGPSPCGSQFPHLSRGGSKGSPGGGFAPTNSGLWGSEQAGTAVEEGWGCRGSLGRAGWLHGDAHAVEACLSLHRSFSAIFRKAAQPGCDSLGQLTKIRVF